MQARHRSAGSRAGTAHVRLVAAAALAAAAVVLLLIGARLHHSVAAEHHDFGPSLSPPASRAAVPSPSSIEHADPSGRADTSGATPPQRVSPPAPAGIPAQVSLPTLGVTASVIPVASSNSVLTVPNDPATLGWWTASALAGGNSGTTVIDGHIDSATSGPGALYRLTDLAAGDLVQLDLAGGGAIRYTVTARHSYVKTNGLPQALFTASGQPHLVLISCGGQFDTATRSYDSNIVVTANPVD